MLNTSLELKINGDILDFVSWHLADFQPEGSVSHMVDYSLYAII
jgi:hypothetical protein